MHLQHRVPLRERTTLGIGGPAERLVEAESETTIAEAVRLASSEGRRLYVLGGGSNIVVSDEGLDGLVLSIATRGVHLEPKGGDVLVSAKAGEPWDGLVELTIERNLAGLECLSGVPGLVGATPIQNVGAYGQEVAECIVSVRALDRKSLDVVTLSHAECRFGYRDSFFKSSEPDRFVVAEVTFRLSPNGAPRVKYPDLERELSRGGVETPSLADVRQAVLAVRRDKSMLFDPRDENGRSCGSFFVNPIVSAAELTEVEAKAGSAMPRWPQPDGRVKLSAAWLIEHAGLVKGTRDGAVGLSTKHSLSVVAHDGARSADVVAFARRIRETVERRFGVRLVPEPVFWGFAQLEERLPI